MKMYYVYDLKTCKTLQWKEVVVYINIFDINFKDIVITMIEYIYNSHCVLYNKLWRHYARIVQYHPITVNDNAILVKTSTIL